jgi:type IV fimbrial biogenesis protein FimT
MKRPSFQRPIRSSGFSLIELLVVIAIVAILTSLTVPMFNSMKRATDLNTATAAMVSLLEQGRAYAMANNTYVFVCFEETDFTTPATQAQSVGTGRVAVQVFYSLDGTENLTPSNLAAVSRMQTFNGLDLPASLSSTTGNLSSRPTATYFVGSSSYPAATTSITSGNYTFSKIIAFDSRGALHIPSNPAQDSLQYLEIDVQPSNGSAVPAAAKNQSAIQVDGLTGAVTTYRS